MNTMYDAQVNSPTTSLAVGIDATQTVITVVDGSILPDAETLLTIGYDRDVPETVKVLSKIANALTVTRAFEGTARVWDGGTSIARIFTAYDYNVLKQNIAELEVGGQPAFTTTDKFSDANYVYFIGDVVGGWKVNRYDIENTLTTSSGIVDKPTTLLDCQALTYV